MKKRILIVNLLFWGAIVITFGQIDWSEAAQKINQTLNQEVSEREKTKLEIENYTNNAINEINNSKLNNENTYFFIVNQFLQVKSDCIDNINAYYRLLKSGQTPINKYRSGIESIKSNFKSYSYFANQLYNQIVRRPESEEKIKVIMNNTTIILDYNTYSFFELLFKINNNKINLLSYRIEINKQF